MRLLIVGLNYAPEPIGIAVYTTGMAEALAQAGHEVRVLTGPPSYPSWRIAETYRGKPPFTETVNGVAVTRVPVVIPKKPNGDGGLLHHGSFAASAFLPALTAATRWKPEVVLCVAPSFAAAPVALWAARLAGARSWLHVQRFGDNTRGADRRTLSGFDRISAISPQMCRAIAGKGIPVDRIVELRNWAEPDVTAGATTSTYRIHWGIRSRHVALYSGAIADRQGLEVVIDAARLLRGREDLTFVICGEGPGRPGLEAMAAHMRNVQIHDLQVRSRLPELLRLATIHLLPRPGGAGGTALPSKLCNMLASGRPVVATAAPGTSLAQEVEGCGLVVPPGEPRAFATAITRLMDDPGLYDRMASSAELRARRHWSKESVLAEFDRQLERLAGFGAATWMQPGSKQIGKPKQQRSDERTWGREDSAA